MKIQTNTLEYAILKSSLDLALMIASDPERNPIQRGHGMDAKAIESKYTSAGMSDTRMLWDLFWMSGMSGQFYSIATHDTNDEHITTALRHIWRSRAIR